MYVDHWLHHVSPNHSLTPMHMHVDHQLFLAQFPLVILAHLSSLVLAFFMPTCISRGQHHQVGVRSALSQRLGIQEDQGEEGLGHFLPTQI
jgi:hypothetical protein